MEVIVVLPIGAVFYWLSRHLAISVDIRIRLRAGSG